MKVASLEQSKWLKGLGFREEVDYYYSPKSEGIATKIKYGKENINTLYHNYSINGEYLSAPSIVDSLNWLYDVKGIKWEYQNYYNPDGIWVGVSGYVNYGVVGLDTIELLTITDCEEALLELIFNHKEKLGL